MNMKLYLIWLKLTNSSQIRAQTMKTKVFEINDPGPQTTIQDLGRYGFQNIGVPVSGPMDSF